ncbi:MAG: molecular chaperone DnaJ [Bdellovibrionota bacterium]
MSKRDYYEVLGVPRDATQDQVKKAYRQLALKLHPDRNPGNKEYEELFKEATEAYQIISNEENRAKYDRFGHAAFAQGAGFDGFSDFGSFAEEIFGDLFGAFFGQTASGGRGGAKRKRSGRDLRYNLTITLEEAANGVEKKIKVRKPVPCEACKATGSRDGSTPSRCKQCGGSGQVKLQQGFFSISRPCSICRGSGSFIADPCPSCGGSGAGQKEKELSVQIPAGIDTGQQLKLRGEGEELANGAAPGDLYVEITIEPHKVFKRQDTEIICEVPVTYAQAVLGADVEVPTLSGPIMMKIPAGSETGKLFRLRGKGIVDLRTGRVGDQHVRTYIYVPQSVSPRERQLLEELASVEGKPKENESRSFLDKVKEFFE